jgi:membrane fusion protein (multidrug efflux system)
VSDLYRIGRGRCTQLLAVAALLLAAACKKAPPPQAPPPPEVGVVTVSPAAVPVSYDFSGEVQPYRRVEVRARVEGVILVRSFTEGQVVRAGQLLYRIDPVRTNAAFEGARARADNARRTLQRLEPLLAEHAVAQQDVDNARAELASAQAALADARKGVEDANVRAEITGRVGRALYQVGDRVTGSDNLLTTIDVVDPVYVVFRPSTQQMLSWRQDPRAASLIQPGSPLRVEVTLSDSTVLPEKAPLDFVAPSLDPETGTQELRAKFSNASHLLTPGQFVRVELTGFTREGALAVPQRAVQQSLGRQFVYVVGAGDSVAARDVQPGPWSGPLWIIDKGLDAGDRVVVDGTQKVRPGGTVHPVPVADTATAAGATTTSAASGARP